MVFNPIGLWLPDYVDGWLPTLDTNMMVDEENLIQYKYYEKPTTTNCTIRQATAMSENCKLQCQSQDLIRRLLNTREELPPKYRASIIDEYGVKLRTSGYAVKVTRKILHNGMKVYVAKVTRRRANNGGRIHRTAAESSKDRLRRKLIGRSSWFKGRKTGSKDMKPQGTSSARPMGTKTAKKTTPWSKETKTRAALFVEQTPRGELASSIREQLQRMEGVMGYKLRVVERTGRSPISYFPQTGVMKREQCGREECVTCTQGGEDLPNCTKQSVVYESICTQFNPEAMKKGELVNVC